MSRRIPIVLALALLAWSCQQDTDTTATLEEAGTTDTAVTAAPAPAAPDLSTPEGKIANAESAAPADIAKNATIMDWPAEEGGEPVQLRAGTNGWTCFPSTPAAETAVGQDPMCLDGAFLNWAQAYMSQGQPSITSVGVAYMLQGDRGASNTDPFAREQTPDNQWVVAGPHIMIVSPNPASLSGITTDPNSGGPWVMWAGTPYAHVMIPVEETP